jgi:hypothetical protein
MATQTDISTFAQIVDKLRNKTEAELKLLYVQLFANEIEKEFEDITKTANFQTVTDDDIVKAIQKSRYGRK